MMRYLTIICHWKHAEYLEVSMMAGEKFSPLQFVNKQINCVDQLSYMIEGPAFNVNKPGFYF